MNSLDCLIGLAASAALTCMFYFRQIQLARKKARARIRI
jgi:hypothetical protein